MGDCGDHFRARREFFKGQDMKNRLRAAIDYRGAKLIAAKSKLTLRCVKVGTHYQLTNGQWLLNIYPGNQRVHADSSKPDAPWIDLPDLWGLEDVVRAAIEADKEAGR